LILEQIVVDNEIAHLCQRLAEGVDCSAEKDLSEDIAHIGPGGHFLGSRSTRNAARSTEFYAPQLIDHHAYEAWLELGKPSMYKAARNKAMEILEQPQVDPLSGEVNDKVDQILRRAEREIPE
jgi:trimethylamine--corrinoid protein Co-methyltransferase